MIKSKDIRALNERGISPQDISKITNVNLGKVYDVLINKAELEIEMESFEDWKNRVTASKRIAFGSRLARIFSV